MPYKPTGRPNGRPRKTAQLDTARPSLVAEKPKKRRLKSASREAAKLAKPDVISHPLLRRKKNDNRKRLTLRPLPVKV